MTITLTSFSACSTLPYSHSPPLSLGFQFWRLRGEIQPAAQGLGDSYVSSRFWCPGLVSRSVSSNSSKTENFARVRVHLCTPPRPLPTYRLRASWTLTCRWLSAGCGSSLEQRQESWFGVTHLVLTCHRKGEDGFSLMQTSPRAEVYTCTNKSATRWTTALAWVE